MVLFGIVQSLMMKTEPTTWTQRRGNHGDQLCFNIGSETEYYWIKTHGLYLSSKILVFMYFMISYAFVFIWYFFWCRVLLLCDSFSPNNVCICHLFVIISTRCLDYASGDIIRVAKHCIFEFGILIFDQFISKDLELKIVLVEHWGTTKSLLFDKE